MSGVNTNANQVWGRRLQTAKASNDVVEVEDAGEDMFARAGVAAE